MSNQQVAQPLPWENVKAVIPVDLDFDEGDDETKYRTGLHVAYNLPLTVKRDVTILRDVAKLPRSAATCFHLDGDVPTGLIGCDEVLSGLPDQFVASPCCHLFSCPNPQTAQLRRVSLPARTGLVVVMDMAVLTWLSSRFSVPVASGLPVVVSRPVGPSRSFRLFPFQVAPGPADANDKLSGGGPRALLPARTPSSRRPLQCLVRRFLLEGFL